MSGIDYSKWDNLECSDDEKNEEEVIDVDTTSFRELATANAEEVSNFHSGARVTVINSTKDNTSRTLHITPNQDRSQHPTTFIPASLSHAAQKQETGGSNAAFLQKSKQFSSQKDQKDQKDQKSRKSSQVEDDMTDFVFSGSSQTTPMEEQEKRLRSMIFQMDSEELEDRDLDEDILVEAFRLLRQRQAEGVSTMKNPEGAIVKITTKEQDTSHRSTMDDINHVTEEEEDEEEDEDESIYEDKDQEYEDLRPSDARHPQHTAFQQLRAMIRNGNAFPQENNHPRYLWSQTREGVTLNVELPSSTRARDINVTLEHGILRIVLHQQVYFEQQLEYPVLSPDTMDSSTQRGLSGQSNQPVECGQSMLQRLTDFEKSGAAAIGIAKASSISIDMDTLWTLYDMPVANPDDQGQTLEKPLRRIEIELYKMAPAGLTVWWKRCFQGEPAIDIDTIPDRRVGGSVAQTLLPSERKLREENENIFAHEQDQDLTTFAASDFDIKGELEEETRKPTIQALTDDELMKIPIQQVKASKNIPDFFSIDHVSRERERIEDGLKSQPDLLSQEEWSQKFIREKNNK